VHDSYCRRSWGMFLVNLNPAPNSNAEVCTIRSTVLRELRMLWNVMLLVFGYSLFVFRQDVCTRGVALRCIHLLRLKCECEIR
jgi:hypothetical protein